MTSPSPIVLVNGLPVPIASNGVTGVVIGAGASVSISLLNPAGVTSWNCFCSSADQFNPASVPALINATIINNFPGFSLTFTAPLMDGYIGSTMQWTSTVNYGTNSSASITFGIFVPNANGSRLFCIGENLESNALSGVCYDLNALQAYNNTQYETSASITYKVDATSSSVVVGDAVSVKGSNVVRGSTGPFIGIALTNGAANTNIIVQVAGSVNAGVSGLAAGAPCAVGVTSTGTLVRAPNTNNKSFPYFIGYCDLTGAVSIIPRTANNFNVLDFGATGTGGNVPASTYYSSLANVQVEYHFATATSNNMDWLAIQAAINATQFKTPASGSFAEGGMVYFPRGNYICDQPINCSGLNGVVLYGAGGQGSNGAGFGAGVLLQYSGTGTEAQWYANTDGYFLNCQSTQNFTMENISVVYSNTTFTGVLVDFSHRLAGHLTGPDSTRMTLRNCQFGGAETITANYIGAFALVSLWSSILGLIDNCSFGRAQQAIRGFEVIANAIGYSNDHNITNCAFNYHTQSVVNPLQMWNVTGCSWDDTGGGIHNAVTFDGPWTTCCQLQFFNVTPTDGYITRSIGSWLLDGWQVNGSTATVANTSLNNGNIGTVTAVTDSMLTVNGNLTAETSVTATISYNGVNTVVPASYTQANQLTFNKGLSGLDGYLQRTGGSFINDGWQAGNKFAVAKTVHNNVEAATFVVVGTVLDGYMAIGAGTNFSTQEISNNAMIWVPIGCNGFNFANNWFGDWFAGYPVLNLLGGLSSFNCTCNFISLSSVARFMVANNGMNGAFFSGNYFDTNTSPLYFLYGPDSTKGISVVGNQCSFNGPIMQVDPSVLMGQLQTYTAIPQTFMAGNSTGTLGQKQNTVNIDALAYLVTGTSVEVDGYGNGFILQSQNNNRWQVLVNNSGQLYTIAAPAVP